MLLTIASDAEPSRQLLPSKVDAESSPVGFKLARVGEGEHVREAGHPRPD